MTAIIDFMDQDSAVTAPITSRGGHRAVARVLSKVVGGALILSAIGLWIMPGSAVDSDLLLIKLVLALMSGFGGLALVQNWDMPNSPPEVEIDVIRRELRLVRRMAQGDEVLEEIKFADLGHAKTNGATVSLWDARGDLIAEAAPTDRKVLASLTSGLRDAGKL